MHKSSRRGLTLAAAILLSSLVYAAGQGFQGERASVSFGASDIKTRFGGFSGLEVSADGSKFWALSDRGALASGRLIRDSKGKLTGLEVENHHRLLDPEGAPVSGLEADSEGLALADDGRIYVSFEGSHRIWTWRADGGEAAWIPRHPDFKKMQSNSSLEALAIGPDGALYTLPERSGSYSAPFPVYRYSKGKWEIVGKIKRSGEWLPVGADFDDQGRLYLLWRHFTGYGFSSRITRVTMAGDLWPGEIVFESLPLSHGNLEGLSLWRDTEGRLRADMISDDNFNSYQRSEIIEITLPD